ncbi:MAG: 4Fe-4S binding protein [Rikenellaceae bacterium]
MDKLKYIVNVLIIAMLFGAIAIGKNDRILGKTSADFVKSFSEEKQEEPTIEQIQLDGTRVINSTTLDSKIMGYAGNTPIKLYIKDGVIQKVKALDNNETPSFFNQVVESGYLDSWNGLTPQEAIYAKVDAVSGSTLSSVAILKNVRRALSYAIREKPKSVGALSYLDLKTIIGVLVIISGVVFTFLKSKNKTYQFIQLSLNVVVLGFWCGSFVSLSQFVSWMSNGVHFASAILTSLFLIIILVLPIYGKKGSYCNIHCPMGSAQELISKIPTPKLKLGSKINKTLNKLRYYILMALLFMMWLGTGFELMDYEVFSAFLLGAASTTVLTMAAVFLLLSLFVHKPYCRFVCPTGALLTMMTKTKRES